MTFIWAVRTHLARPDLGAHAHVRAPSFMVVALRTHTRTFAHFLHSFCTKMARNCYFLTQKKCKKCANVRSHLARPKRPHARTSHTRLRMLFARTRTCATAHRTCACAHAPSQPMPWFFGLWDDKIICFWNLLTFRNYTTHLTLVCSWTDFLMENNDCQASSNLLEAKTPVSVRD